MNFKFEWLTQGHFELRGDTLMQEIRDRLASGLGRSLKISTYPAHAGWRDTYWWHEREGRYTEARFFMQIAEEYPILSFGVSVEKGVEDEAAAPPSERDWIMDRQTWDWERLMNVVSKTIRHDIPKVAGALKAPIMVRVSTSQRDRGEAGAREDAGFVFAETLWQQRHVWTASEASPQTDERPWRIARGRSV